MRVKGLTGRLRAPLGFDSFLKPSAVHTAQRFEDVAIFDWQHW